MRWDATRRGVFATRISSRNPARLNTTAAVNVCLQCHSQGQLLNNPINGKYYDWPVGFEVGKDLDRFWKLEEHKLGEQSFTHFADGTARKNRMQGNDFVPSAMYTHGIACTAVMMYTEQRTTLNC
ncbi:MAG TPA: hypothetical protein VN519_10375 [Bryobacteraceae bacterium]|nr:hypothetical protein [Bryobacteraceae bacterium]